MTQALTTAYLGGAAGAAGVATVAGVVKGAEKIKDALTPKESEIVLLPGTEE